MGIVNFTPCAYTEYEPRFRLIGTHPERDVPIVEDVIGWAVVEIVGPGIEAYTEIQPVVLHDGDVLTLSDLTELYALHWKVEARS